jgi:hypothetical protein
MSAPRGIFCPPLSASLDLEETHGANLDGLFYNFLREMTNNSSGVGINLFGVQMGVNIQCPTQDLRHLKRTGC